MIPFFFILMFLSPSRNVTLTWTLNPENDISGYHLYYGRASGFYDRSVTVTAPPVTVKVPSVKTTYFAVTAYDTEGLESGYSNEVQYP